jgi:hypothetical protein
MKVSAKMIPVETTPGIGRRDEVEMTSYMIHC